MERDLFKGMNAQNLQNAVQTHLDCEFLAQDGDQRINAHGNPDLCFDGIDADAQETLDAQMLLDPFEEKFDLPAKLVKLTNAQSREIEMVGQESQEVPGLGVVVVNQAQIIGKCLAAVIASEASDLVAAHARSIIGWQGAVTHKAQIVFGASEKECLGLMDQEKAGKVAVSAIHDIKSARFQKKVVEDVDVVRSSLGDRNERGNGSSQIEQSMELDGCFGGAETCPGKQTQAQVDSGRIQSIDRIGKLHPQFLADIQLARPSYQNGSQVGINPPIAVFVGIGPVCFEKPPNEFPNDKVDCREHADKLRCPANSLEKSIGQKPCTGIGPSKKSSAPCNLPHNVEHSGETSEDESTP